MINSQHLHDLIDASYEWSSAMRVFRELHPDSSAMHMLECSRCLSEGDASGAIDHFLAIRTRVGDDGFLNQNLATLYSSTGQLDLARPEIVKSMSIGQTIDSYVLGLQIAKELDDEKWISQILNSISESSGCDLQVLESQEKLIAVRETQAYQTWKQSQLEGEQNSTESPRPSGSSIRELLRRK